MTGVTLAGTRSQLRAFLRKPLTLVLLALVPLVTVVGFGEGVYQSTGQQRPVAPRYAFGALLAGGLIYALLGVLIGAVVPAEFEASLVVIFVANMDAFLGSGIATVDGAISRALPLHFPSSILRAAITDGAVDSSALVGTALVVALLCTLVAVLYSRSLGLHR